MKNWKYLGGGKELTGQFSMGWRNENTNEELIVISGMNEKDKNWYVAKTNSKGAVIKEKSFKNKSSALKFAKSYMKDETIWSAK